MDIALFNPKMQVCRYAGIVLKKMYCIRVLVSPPHPPPIIRGCIFVKLPCTPAKSLKPFTGSGLGCRATCR